MVQPDGYVDVNYLQTAARFLRQTKEKSYVLMRAQTGSSVLDVGCGPGTDTIPLGKLVGPTGRVTGIDYDPEMILKAGMLAEEMGLSGWVSHKQADCSALPFEDGCFDASRSERLFQHLVNPAQALSEMIRVTRRGGWIVVLDTDWGTGSVDTPEVEIERLLGRFHAEKYLHNGYSGRQLFALFKRAGLTDISIEAYTNTTHSFAIFSQIFVLDRTVQKALAANALTEDEARRFTANLEKADADGVFFASLTGFMVTGLKQ